MSAYPPPPEVSHFLREELKNAQQAIKDANLEYEKNKEAKDALMKIWYNRKTRKRREFDPEKTQRLQDELNRIHEQWPILREGIEKAEKYEKYIKQRIRNVLYYDHLIPETKRDTFIVQYGPKPSSVTANPTSEKVWLQTTSDEEISRRPKPITSSSSSDHLFSTSEDEEEVQPSPLSVPYEDAPPPPEEEYFPAPPKHVEWGPLPHQGRHTTLKRFPKPQQQVLPPEKPAPSLTESKAANIPKQQKQQVFPKPAPFLTESQAANIRTDQLMTPDALHRYEINAQAEYDEAIRKRNELEIQLDQERKQKRIFRHIVKSIRMRRLTPDRALVDQLRKSRYNAKYIRFQIKDNENNIQPQLRQKVEGIQNRLRLLALRLRQK
jgi:hypothetical protein